MLTDEGRKARRLKASNQNKFRWRKRETFWFFLCNSAWCRKKLYPR